jgi:membrane associated rhomboid family serine protease
MPHITPVVKWLLIINVAVFLIGAIIPKLNDLIEYWFSVLTVSKITIFLQPWRYITYQFLHHGLWHIFFNMLILFFFGPMFERQWGSKRFIRFYLICGAAGGILYSSLVLLNVLGPGLLVGASGAIYGLLAATAVLYPSMRVYIFGVFPMPMAVVALLMVAFSVSRFLGGVNAGGEAAHLAGLAAGALMIVYQPWMSKRRLKKSDGAWQRKMQMQQDFQSEIDRILDKVHTQGVKSLTRKEKSILKRATEIEQGE